MIETPFNYTGSKFKLLNQILPLMDYTKPYFVDLFCGGGSVYTNILDRYEKVFVNDIISDLIGIHESLLNDDSIIHSTKSLCPGKNNKSGYYSLRDNYNSSPSPDKLWALILSCVNNMIRFNQKFKFNQTYGERGWNGSTEKKVNSFINHIRQYKNKLNYSSLKFNNFVIPPSGDYMFYIDPPYGRIKDDLGGIGKKQVSEAGYNCFWELEDDLNLYNYILNIHNMGSSFMVSGVLSHNGLTCWMIDKLISDGFNFLELNHNYNQVSKKGEKTTIEVIITNY